MAEMDRLVAAKEILRKEKERQVEALTKNIKTLTETADLTTRAEQVLIHVSTRVLGQSTNTIDKLVTAGLKIVFDDQTLEFRTEVDKYRGKTAINFQLLQDGRSTPIMDSYGGGVLVVAGVLLRVVTIVTLKMRRFLLLDESLSHLSIQYVPAASLLLSKLCEELDFTILMVTHEQAFADNADTHYLARKTNGVTVFEKQTRAKNNP